MAGISSKAAGGLENKYKYNGIELDTSLGLDEYEAALRDLDPQTGRWWQVDPETEDQEMWSPYASNYDNPILYKDPRGNEGEACCGGIVQLGEGALDIYRAVRGGENVLDAAKGNGISVGGVINGIGKLIEFDQGGLIKVNPKDLPANKNSKTVELTQPPDTYVLIQPSDTKTPNPNGRNGGQKHQDKIDQEEKRMQSKGMKTQREAKVETPGGNKSKRFIDVQGTNPQTGEVEQVQVGKQNKNGTPVSRERKALDDVEKATGKRPKFIPYNN